MSRRAAIVFITCFAGLLVIATSAKGALDAMFEPHHRDSHRRVVGKGQVKFDGAGPERWAMRWRREHQAVTNLAKQVRRQRRLLRRLQAPPRRTTQSASTGRSVPAIICVVFPDCAKALSVARCESGYSVTATNGQYFGVFQMGSAERARFGGSSLDPWDQVRAAYAYWRVAGWAPWQCA